MNTNEDDLRARLLAAWKDGRIVNMPKPGEPGKRVVGYVIEWDESFPMLPGAIIAALAPHSGGEGDAFPEIENLIDECMDAGAKTYFFNVTQRMPPGVEWMPFPNVARKKLLDAIRRLATPTPQAAGVSEAVVDSVRADITSRAADDGHTHIALKDEWVRAALEAVWPTAAGAAPEGCGVALIAAERQRQIAAEGWTPEHDDAYQHHELARAAACYATANWGWDQASQVFRADVWPWDEKWWKPDPKNQLRNLARAGALIAAEIDRLQRATPNPGAQHGQEGRDHD